MLWAMQARTVEEMIRGSLEWKPQATLARSMWGRTSESGPWNEGIGDWGEGRGERCWVVDVRISNCRNLRLDRR